MANIYEAKTNSELKHLVTSNKIAVIGIVMDITPSTTRQFIKKFLKHTSKDEILKDVVFVYFVVDSSKVSEYGLSFINSSDPMDYPKVIYIYNSKEIVLRYDNNKNDVNTMRYNVTSMSLYFKKMYLETSNNTDNNDNTNTNNNGNNTNNVENDTNKLEDIGNAMNDNNQDNSGMNKYDFNDPKIQKSINDEIIKRKLERIIEKKKKLKVETLKELHLRMIEEKRLAEEYEEEDEEDKGDVYG